jgi:putative phosphotransacetylase
MTRFELRITVSNSHVHLCEAHVRTLFGTNELRGVADIGHPKFESSNHTVTLVGPKGSLAKIRVLSPATRETWVELNRTHAFALGVSPPLDAGEVSELSGESVAIHGPHGSIEVAKNVVIELRHIEVTPAQARTWGLSSGQIVAAEIGGPRAALLRNVKVRIVDDARAGFDGVLELDRDEANAVLASPGQRATIIVE